MDLRRWADDAFAEAIGRERRHDPVLPVTGGPAGNAKLTAWTGLVLLVLFFIEGVTLLDLGRLLSWHIVVGVLLVPPALLKTGSTGWRILGYYTGRAPYRRAGPPPALLRILGPLVVLSTLALLGSGLALVALGPFASRSNLLTILGHGINAVIIHKVIFVGWFGVTSLHTLGRLLPAIRIVAAPLRAEPGVPGWRIRGTVLVFTLLVAAIAATTVLGLSGPWLHGGLHHVVR
ncbi:MAG TPA: hypothetical protein VKU87_01920 [Thermomicrobiaceae bacterium]|nr:hypothetical protein [Thermomicrobiaceae bacterium]